jgi:small-conductance mechanosensitive channel
MSNTGMIMEANSSVIMMEIIIYFVVSFFLLILMDWYAGKKIGNKNRMGYKILRIPKVIALFIITIFTLVIGVLCLWKDLTVSRYTLTYFGLPYFLALVYYMVKMLRRVRSETRFHP